MLRTHFCKIFSLEPAFSLKFWKNNSNFTYKNTYHCVTAAYFSTRAKISIHSNERHDHGSRINRKDANLSDREYLVGLKADPDTFGSQSRSEFEDEGDIEEEKYFTEQPLPSEKLSTKKYADIIKALINNRKIKEAIDFVEVKMVKEDRVKPKAYIYNLLLGACGRVGYTKKAFMLYNDMKRRGLPVMGGTYTALFNACSNSPWCLTDGLTRAKHLYEIMTEKGYEPNDTTYNAMIKAFGRCGDLTTSFLIVDQMLSKGLKLKSETITFLLQACISDQDAGFRHALLVWRKLVDKKIKPSVYTYNTFLRSIRDCGLGDIETTKDVINKILPSKDGELLLALSGENSSILSLSKVHSTENADKITSLAPNTPSSSENPVENPNKIGHAQEHLTEDIHDGGNKIEFVSHTKIQNDSNLASNRPNLMATVPRLGSLLSLSEVKEPHERLLLVGGMKGFLESMDKNQCVPDIKTFTQLLECIPGSLTAEQELLAALKKLNVVPDISFYNILMKKRSMRCDYEGAKV